MSGESGEWELKPPKGSGIFGAVFDQIAGFFVAGFQSVWSGFLELVPRAVTAGLETVRTYFDQGEDVVWDGIISVLADMSVLDKATIANLTKLKGLPFPINSVVNTVVITLLLGEYLKTIAHATGAPARWNLNKMMSPELPFHNDVIQAAFVAPEKTGEVREIMRKSGLSNEIIDLLFISAYRLYDENMIRTLWLRKEIDNDTMFMRMRELGYTDTRIKEIVRTWEIIPSPQDLLYMVGKEAFEPDSIQLMGLGDEFPEEQSEWLEKQGLSRYWQEKYWFAHWDQPSIQMGFEMFHRGEIGLEELDMLFRTVEIPPFWRQKLINIAFNPYTRVDVRRMHDLGVINDAELIQAYKDLGYNDEKAAKMADFTKRYNAKSKKDLSLSQITNGYRKLILSRKEAVELLQDLDYDEDNANYLLDIEDYKDLEEYEDAIIANIQLRFEGNLMDAATARVKLNELNLPAIRIEALIEKWTVNRYEDMKLPSKTDLDKFLKKKVITEDQYREQMYLLGYNSTYIEWYLQIV